MRRVVGAGVAVRPDLRQQSGSYAVTADFAGLHAQLADKRATVGRFFFDLRNHLRLSPAQAALSLQTRVEVIQALEAGNVEFLPPWAETTRIISIYTGYARVDARPVITVVADVMRHVSSVQNSGPNPAYRGVAGSQTQRHGDRTLQRASAAIAAGARRFPVGAARHLKGRPDRVFYALSVPLAAVLVVLNASSLEAVGKPFKGAVSWVSGSMQEMFPTLRDGFRWIDVADPRSRRSDKLPTHGR